MNMFVLGNTNFPFSLMKRSGLNLSGSTKCLGSFMMKEMLAMKLDPLGKVYVVFEFGRVTVVDAVAVCGIEDGATLAIL